MSMPHKQPFLTRFFIAQAKRITVPFIKGIEDMLSDDEKKLSEGIDIKRSPIYNDNSDKNQQ
jgi:hypothetical protein